MSGPLDETKPATPPPTSDTVLPSPSDAIAAQKERAKAVLDAANTDQDGGHDAAQQDQASAQEGLGQRPPSRKRKRETTAERIQTDQYVTREYLYKADLAEYKHKPLLLQQKQQEVQYYQKLAPLRQQKPGLVFGVGYEGFGNPRTDDRTVREPLIYPRMRRAGKKQTRPPRVPRKDQAIQAEQDEELVPIRLDIEWGKIKLRDTFTWNLYDHTTNIDYYAEKVVEDFGLDVKACDPLIRKIAADIREQLQDYTPHVFTLPEPLDPHLPYTAYKNDEMRILVKLNITIGQNTLIDQFEWEVNNPYNSPEEFARQMTHDLSLAGEFTTAIAHCIREQCQLYSKSLHLTGFPFDGRVIDDPDLKENFLQSPLPTLFRPYQMAKEYSPYIYELNEADLERTELSISRAQRHQKRSTNRRGGPALPDLREKPKTIRSLVVSSVIPGGALSMEDSRIFRAARQSRRVARGARDEFEESEDSASADDSGPDSPAIPAHLLPSGPSRSRGTMRSAALTASAGIRSNLTVGRSATPESSAAMEPRSAARRRDYKEADSDDDGDKLVVVLKVGKKKLAAWSRAQGLKDRTGHGSNMGSPMPPQRQKAAPLNLAAQPPPPPNTKPQENMFGAIDATWHPPSAEHPAPPPPDWLTEGLEKLRSQYQDDRFQATMKHTAIDPATGGPVPADEKNKHFEHKYVPRIRCLDCPGKLYVTGPGMTAERFEAHLKNRKHRESVEARLDQDG
ncbi:SWI/SNF chromatin-remodeling complex subunit [Knufia fluminis]|uniref:SWI/SNF chromatin-remodeling complex subunit n=1 Tax=Knufia fluminis TaxID=191047 RepID=A0AAN8EJ81_9EURO|nr:SWI/SNF chromatin-remodeling complex subunit [Knufia fluminis]